MPERHASTSTGPSREHRAHLLLRIAAMLIGLPLLSVALGAWLGMLIESPWISLGLGAVLSVLPTLLLADRLLPADDPRKGNGIATDVIASVWLGGATLLYGPLAFLLHAPLLSWTERAAGPGIAVSIADFVTGVPRDTEASDEASTGETSTGEAQDTEGATEAAGQEGTAVGEAGH